MGAIDEVVARSEDCQEARSFHNFHRNHPEVLDFLIEEIGVRFNRGFTAFSYHRLWQYANWKLETEKGPGNTFLMDDSYAPFYAHAIAILHPEFDALTRLGTGKAAATPETRSRALAREAPEERFVWGRWYGLAAWLKAHAAAPREQSSCDLTPHDQSPCDQNVEPQLAAS